MKKHEWVFALILTLTIIFMVYLESKVYKRESIPSNKEAAILTLTARIDKISNSIAKIPTDYTDEIMELTRENEQLRMENKALKDYINGFEDKFWKGR